MNNKSSETILSNKTKQEINKKIKNDNTSGNTFDIAYSGLIYQVIDI